MAVISMPPASVVGRLTAAGWRLVVADVAVRVVPRPSAVRTFLSLRGVGVRAVVGLRLMGRPALLSAATAALRGGVGGVVPGAAVWSVPFLGVMLTRIDMAGPGLIGRPVPAVGPLPGEVEQLFLRCDEGGQDSLRGFDLDASARAGHLLPQPMQRFHQVRGRRAADGQDVGVPRGQSQPPAPGKDVPLDRGPGHPVPRHLGYEDMRVPGGDPT
ncbi:hypothetical protein [Micromonospora purpureochromogenes]|uniref:hypothetical protein n=1 Tax=Micromonospora purpureochromogenes TaxID=47872 RepID=UPI001E62AAE4|nr:hypothetical protein [Micromonospora purpureochromogenes]